MTTSTMLLESLRGWRKVLVWVLLMTGCAGLLLHGDISADNFTEIAIWVTLGLLGANSVAHVTGVLERRGGREGRGVPPVVTEGEGEGEGEEDEEDEEGEGEEGEALSTPKRKPRRK